MRRIAAAAQASAAELDLSNLGLTVLPETIGQLTQLRVLNLDNNRLTALPDAIGLLTHLEKLLLGGNKLTALPSVAEQLAQLRSIDLRNNSLTSLPAVICQLSQLRELNLVENRVPALPDAIGQLKYLQVLNISGNRLAALPETIGHLSRLKVLWLYNNQLTMLPETFEQLVQLERLSLCKNQFQELPGVVSRLKRLRELNLEENQLLTLPPLLRQMSDLKSLYLRDNPKLGLPAELLGPSFVDVVGSQAKAANPADILDYYFRTRLEARPLNEAKLILVGFGEVGKTSLVNRLVHDTFAPGEAKTEGIATAHWPIRLNGTEDVSLHVWDFGGQEIMHATHRFFLSQRSLYLLVLNGRGGRQQADAAYWLNLIATYAPGSPVIIVRNKIREDPCALDRTALRRDFPAIRDVIDTDCADPPIGIDALATAIRRETDALPELRSRFPTTWFAIKDRLAAMSQNYISFDDYRALCASNGETDPAAQELLAVALNCLGIVLNFRDDPRLHDPNVLNPH